MGTNRHRLLASPQAASALTTMALGELVFDKLPFAPSRLSPAALSGRLLIGAMCGAAVSPKKDERAGALLGVAGALASSFAGYAIRRSLARATRVPDPFIALLEDGLAIGIGMAAANMDSETKKSAYIAPSARVA
jgi:uncharacterized membrane protein